MYTVYAMPDFVVPLVKAVQELSKMNDDKDARIDDLQKQINEAKAMITGNTAQPTSNALMAQNIPNPFTLSTRVDYELPQKYSSARIIVTDKTGEALKQINVSGQGKGSVNIDAAMFAAGTYQYSLYVDEKLISTKQMVLVR